MVQFLRLHLQSLLLIGVLAVALIGLPPAATTAQTPPDEWAYVAHEVIVKIPGPGKRMLNSIAADYNLDKKPLAEFGSRQIYRLRILDGMAPPAKVAQLLQDPRVTFAEVNYLSSIPSGSRMKRWAVGSSSDTPGSNWATEQINLAQAPGRGAGIVVAVLDTGVDVQHRALRNRLVPGYDFVDNRRTPAERGNEKRHAAFGHGTHVASLIAQVAPEARIMPVRVLDPDGYGNLWVLAEALRFAIDPNGDGNPADGAQIINLSLTIEQPTQLLRDILGGAVLCTDHDANPTTPDTCEQHPGTDALGVLVIAAAGNDDDGDPATPLPTRYPAAEPEVIGVTATNAHDRKADFANHSSAYVDIAAPGVAIAGLAPRNRYATWDGTSMATALVSGAAAAIWSADLSSTSADVRAQLFASVTPIDQLNPQYGGQLGTGRLDFAPAPTVFEPLHLTSMCTIDPQVNLARWRVRNINPYAVTYTWEIYGTPQRGERTVAAASDDSFNAPGGTMIVTGGGHRTTKATNPALCTP